MASAQIIEWAAVGAGKTGNQIPVGITGPGGLQVTNVDVSGSPTTVSTDLAAGTVAVEVWAQDAAVYVDAGVAVTADTNSLKLVIGDRVTFGIPATRTATYNVSIKAV
jgi:hypothetical protein